MEDRTIKTHRFSTKKLQNLISESVCRTLRFDILNLDHDIEEFKEILNKKCRILQSKELVGIYFRTHGEEIGDTIRESINSLFSHEELKEAYLSTDHTQIYEKLYEHFKSKTNGNTLTNDMILMMLEYRVEGYIQEELYRTDY